MSNYVGKSNIIDALKRYLVNLKSLFATKTEMGGKADKVSGAVADDIATLDANGNLTDGGKKISDLATTTSVASKADKVSGATAGDIAVLNANGNLEDSGKKASDFASKTVVTNIANNIASILDGSTVVGKAQKDQNGNVIDTTYATKAEMTTADNNLQAQIDELMGRKVFGIHINGALSDPDSMVTYLEDAVGMTPAHMDFANDVFDYGSWENAFFLPKPCMLKYDGTVDYYLDPNDYTKKIDGTASDVANDTYAGNAMMEWPKIWLKMVPDTDPKSASVYISNYKADDDFHCWSNINSKGAEVDHFYTPIYNGSIVSSKLRSISGKAYSALCKNKTAQQEIDLAHANNPSTDILWETELYADIQLIQWLLVLISKSLDSASKFGEGRRGQASAASSMLGTGTMDGKGLFWGSNTTTYGVKVFGMENFWGNQWRRYEGHVMVNGVQKIKLTYGQEDGSSTNGYNTTGNGYLTADETTPSGTSGGYLSQMLFTDKGSVPQVANGSSTTYFCDGLWFNNSDTRVALRGGSADTDARVGLFYCHLHNTASSAYWNIGASVSCKPLAR